MATLSILIITYNRPDDLLALLKDIDQQEASQEYLKEVLILNNASTVSYKPVEDFINNHKNIPITYIPHNENLGVARGRNFLIDKATGKYILMIDDDMEFGSRDAIKTMAVLFEQPQYIENNTAIITLNTFYYSTRQRQDSAFPHKNLKEYGDKHWFLTYYFAGGAHIVKKEVFDKVGIYPVNFFYGMEEYDFSYRIIDAGYTLAFDDSVLLLHKESPTGRVPNKEKLSMMWVNKSKVAWRYLPKKYFYSTAFMWGLQYLKKTGFNLPGFFKSWLKIFKIPATETRNPISETSIQYLHKVQARLSY